MNSKQSYAHDHSIANCYYLVEAGETLSAKHEIKALLKNKEVSQVVNAVLTGLYHSLDENENCAIAAFKMATAHDEEYLEAHYYLAKSYINTGLIKQAIDSLSRITSLDNTHAKAWFLLGSIKKEQNNILEYRDCLLKAIKYDVDNSTYWKYLLTLVSHPQVRLPSDTLNILTIEVLTRHQINPLTIAPILYSLLDTNASLRKLKSLHKNNSLSASHAIGLLNDDLLLAVMQGATLFGPIYEILLSDLRKVLLKAISTHTLAAAETDKAITCISALSIYCLATEFVFYVADDELQLLENCKHKICNEQNNDKQAALLYAMIGCYEPLFTIIGATAKIQQLEQIIDDSQFQSMVYYHIHEKKIECARKEEIISLDPIEDNISQAVQQQYEENPYPRWITGDRGTPVTLDRLLAHRFPYLKPDQMPNIQARADQPINILIAGCGTGRNAIMAAQGFFNSNVYAIDLSKSSLAYASMKADQCGIDTITFRHGDLLNLPSLDRQFDMIDSSGVLHHMKNPRKGIAALDKCLKAGGWMRIALYSHIARKTIRKAREEVRKLGIETTAADIRDFRNAIINNPQHPLYELCTTFRDFYSMSECRDLIFHVQEHEFTTAQLQELIKPFDLEFMGFEQVAPALYRRGSPITDPQSLEQWGAFEETNPTAFAGMYHIWLRKPQKNRSLWPIWSAVKNVFPTSKSNTPNILKTQ